MTPSAMREREPERGLPRDGAVPAHADGHAGAGALPSLMGNQRFQRRLARRAGDEGSEPSALPARGASALESLILPDSAPGPTLGGMRKGSFLKLLESEVTRGAEEELHGTGRTTAGCPWIAYWLRYYERRDAAQLARAIEKYAPEAASAERPEDVVAIVRDRVRAGVRRSLHTGTIQDLPPGIPLEAFAPGSEASIPVGEPPTDPFGLTPAPVHAEAPEDASNAHPLPADLGLGEGAPLDTRTRARMESAFRTDLSDVRLHDDAAGRTAADRRSARAFAYGSDIALGSRGHEPGTPAGDALLAHEIAHVLQQRPARESATSAAPATHAASRATESAAPSLPAVSAGAPAPVPSVSTGAPASAPLEADADRSAAGAMRSLWGGGAPDSGFEARPARASSLRVSSCGGSDDPSVAKTVQVKPITFFDSTGNPSTDISFGNSSVWNQANMSLNQLSTRVVDQTETERLIGPDHEVDTRASGQSAEEQGLLSELGSETLIPLVYVKEVKDQPGAAIGGEQLPATCGNTTVILVENGLSSQGMNHEVGHALGLEHKPSDATNLMFPVEGVTNTTLDADQIKTVRSSRYAS